MTVECDLSVHRTEPLIDCPVETSTIAAYNLLYRALSELIVNLLRVHSLILQLIAWHSSLSDSTLHQGQS